MKTSVIPLFYNHLRSPWLQHCIIWSHGVAFACYSTFKTTYHIRSITYSRVEEGLKQREHCAGKAFCPVIPTCDVNTHLSPFTMSVLLSSFLISGSGLGDLDLDLDLERDGLSRGDLLGLRFQCPPRLWLEGDFDLHKGKRTWQCKVVYSNRNTKYLTLYRCLTQVLTCGYRQ